MRLSTATVLASGLGAHKQQSQGLCPGSFTPEPDRTVLVCTEAGMPPIAIQGTEQSPCSPRAAYRLSAPKLALGSLLGDQLDLQVAFLTANRSSFC